MSMNLQDCIDIIKNCTTLACEYHIKDKCDYGYEVRENRFECAKKLATQALEEIQAYRALGTIEELKRVVAFIGDDNYSIVDELKLLNQYRAIGTVAEFKALKEKAEPKKPIIHGLGQRYCPVCKCGGADHFYCTRCGQKLV